ncbi:hypothetical protein, partial [Bacillus toyonensis]|uniref:hypothetical protein n=1 Tax=Bacillus toyonensis TaxID=155322 RepID=UPI001C54FA3C
PAIPCPNPIHLPPTHFAFIEEGVFLAKMIKIKLVALLQSLLNESTLHRYLMSMLYFKKPNILVTK